MKLTFLALSLISLSGCATLVPNMPGNVSVNESKFDGRKEITSNPGWCTTGMSGSLQIGLFKSSSMKPDEVYLVGQVIKIDNIEAKDSLAINIDGEITKFSSTDERTAIALGDQPHSSRMYLTDMSFVRKFMAGKNVQARITLFNNKYVDGDCSLDQISHAKWGFKNFMEKLPVLDAQPARASASVPVVDQRDNFKGR